MTEHGNAGRIRRITTLQREYFAGGETLDIGFRKRSLRTLLDAIRDGEAAISQALFDDLHKSPFESYATEIGLVREELTFFIRNLARLAAPRRASTPITLFKASSAVHRVPYGNVLIMSPWNYPFQLAVLPLVGALAAGNTAVVKPSNYAPATSRIIAETLSACFPEKYVAVLEGGRDTNTALLDQKFDCIFFTGSATVGKVVMEAASRHLTPVSLELGGKSPCIVDATAKVDLAAKRIAWGKLLNAGQTCVAPDYVLADKRIVPELLERLAFHIEAFFGPSTMTNPEYPKIISEKHFERLRGLIEGSAVHYGGKADAESLRISPTILHPVGEQDPVMGEEIFGPVLPVLSFDDIDEALAIIRKKPSPLALYLFTSSKAVERRIVDTVPFGGGCINDTVLHVANANLPFGGIGDSGMGRYHGKESFTTFSHAKSVLKKSTLFDPAIRYPPYGKKLGLLKKVMK